MRQVLMRRIGFYVSDQSLLTVIVRQLAQLGQLMQQRAAIGQNHQACGSGFGCPLLALGHRHHAKTAQILDIKRQAVVHRLETKTKPSKMTCLSFSSDGKLIATGNENGVVEIWNVHVSIILIFPLLSFK
jgi:hypothetical protein